VQISYKFIALLHDAYAICVSGERLGYRVIFSKSVLYVPL